MVPFEKGDNKPFRLDSPFLKTTIFPVLSEDLTRLNYRHWLTQIQILKNLLIRVPI